MSDNGKGSKPRPFTVSNEEYAARWDVIFARDKPQEPEAVEVDIPVNQPQPEQ